MTVQEMIAAMEREGYYYNDIDSYTGCIVFNHYGFYEWFAS